LQAFVQGNIGYIEDFAMPSTYCAAIRFIAAEQAEAIAILDMRLFNTDRHGGNLLLRQLADHGGSHSLVPIDHGCCLPPWWSMAEAHFDAWRGWPQLLAPPSGNARAIIEHAVQSLPTTIKKLQDIGLETASIVTLQLCTLFLEIGVLVCGLPLNTLAELLSRDDKLCFEKPSWFEEQIATCTTAAGVPCHFALSPYCGIGPAVQCLVADDGREFGDVADSLDVGLLIETLRQSLKDTLPLESERGSPLQ